MARVVIIVGSRRDGNSAILGSKLQEALYSKRISNDLIIPGNQKIYLCTGCMDCDKNGVCDFKDDMVKNIALIEEAECLIFISPVRWNLLSGDIKIFMDRLNPLYASRKLAGKKMIALVVGSQVKSAYSLDGAITSLGSFAESSGLELIYKNEFSECLKYNDILNQEEKMNAVINDIVNLFNE